MLSFIVSDATLEPQEPQMSLISTYFCADVKRRAGATTSERTIAAAIFLQGERAFGRVQGQHFLTLGVR